jgi:hypothetical protein
MQVPALSIEMIGVVLLSVILSMVLVAYDRLLRKVQLVKQDEERYSKSASVKAEKIIDMARIRAQKILDEANLTSRELQQELDKMVDDASKLHMGEYKEKIQNISNSIENKLQKGAEEYGKILEMETIAAQKAVAKKLEAEYKRIEGELAEYREKRLAEINDKLSVSIEVGLKKAFGLEIGEKINEDIARKAIEEARNSHVI